ncbi:MAG: gamma carbonic anhydrase family protein, partial [Gammaproteobacteria bacterium]
CLIGMGSTILSRANIGIESIVGAGALVTEDKSFPPRSLILGAPAKLIREVTEEEINAIRLNALHYVNLSKKYIKDLESSLSN